MQDVDRVNYGEFPATVVRSAAMGPRRDRLASGGNPNLAY
jgi:hypothetical protein